MAVVFVRGFDFGTTAEALKKYCAKAGPVKSVEMQDKGSAIVTYGNDNQANAACAKLNGTTLPGNTRYIDVKLDDGKKRSAPGADGCTVFVRGFDFGTPDEQFEAHCGSVGTIASVKWITRGSAECTYSTPEEAQAAVESLNKTTMEGNSRFIDVLMAEGGERPAKRAKGSAKGNGKGGMWMQMPAWQNPMMQLASILPAFGKGKGKGKGKGGKPDPPGSGRVFVRGFDFGTTDEQLMGHMSQVGEVADVHWSTRGQAVVVFKKKASANKAVSQLANSVIEGNTRFIDVLAKESE